ncbi:transporter [Streptomyces sp. KMM 9044]|uniref:transporter n=1 Tax=Streptomyces sp. KMM 9044 TaxID=2744474 RepID=UPI00215115CD|nr:transporter [Streptomyces sp. KMM 9044]WAX77136.1 transporter [Streptomyces sp. KMM 9044]
MIWLTWRQFRAQALTAAVALVGLAAYLVYLGMQMRDSYDKDVVGCTAGGNCEAVEKLFLNEYELPVFLASVLLIAIPALIGLFWGAPLITRELEAGTHRLVWNQSISRTRWLVVKLGFVAMISAVVVGVFSLLLTWAASPYDRVQGERFDAIGFMSRNITPIGYAVFAFILAATVGLLIRRTMPAMAITLAAVAAIQLIVPFGVRPHLQQPVSTTVALTADTQFKAFRDEGDEVQILGYNIPGAWMLDKTHTLYDSAGKAYDEKSFESCFSIDMDEMKECVAKRNLHVEVSYQPADRYWRFQWMEAGGYLALTALLVAFCISRIRRPLL